MKKFEEYKEMEEILKLEIEGEEVIFQKISNNLIKITNFFPESFCEIANV